MTGPFKLKSGNSPLFKNMGSSPVDTDQIAHEKEQSKSSKTSYKQAWDNMNDDQRNKYDGSFANFRAAAEKYNKEN